MNEELKIVISAQVDKLKKGCQDATKAINNVDDSAQKAGKNTDSAFSKMGEAAKKAGAVMGKALVAGTTAAIGGIVALSTAAIKSYAEYEQLTGGVETLFKDSADAVKQYANEAYKTAGLSANEYMETVTSFSASLLQSLGGDTKKASEAANQAVIDMADNANKMGTSMESIQNAYQGFAKQNYTMLDNLKLGYGGTKEEMARLVADAAKVDASIDANSLSFDNVCKAIHAVQTEMGITGTTSKEAASTISGSVSMMKSAWSNLVTGIADENANFKDLIANFVDSVSTVAANLMPRIEESLRGVLSLVNNLLPQLIEMIMPLIVEFTPQLIGMGVSIITALVEGIAQALPQIVTSIVGLIPTVIESLLGMLPTLIEAGVQMIVALLQGIVQALPTVVQTVASMIPQIVDTLVTNIPILLQAAIDFLMAIVDAIPQIIPPLVEALPSIIDKILQMLVANIDVVMDAGIELMMALVDAIPLIIPSLVDAIPKIIDSLIEAFIQAYPKMLQCAGDLFMALVNAIPKVIVELRNGCKQIVSSVVTNLVNKLLDVMGFDWKLPKLKLPTVSIKGKFSLSPLEVPKFSIKWNALGGVFDKPTLFNYGGSIQGLGEDGAEAVVPLERNTQWLDRLATMLNEKQGGGQPIILQVDGKTFAETTITTLNDLTRQTGKLPLKLA